VNLKPKTMKSKKITLTDDGKGELISSNTVDINKLIPELLAECELLNKDQLNSILYKSGSFKEVVQESLNEYQLKHIHDYININYLIREGKSIDKASEIVGTRKQNFFEIVCMHREFTNYYTRSLEHKSHILAEKTLLIAEDDSKDMFINKDGVLTPNGVAVQRSRLHVEAIQYYIGKTNASVYGNKTTVSGDPENPLKVVAISGMVIE